MNKPSVHLLKQNKELHFNICNQYIDSTKRRMVKKIIIQKRFVKKRRKAMMAKKKKGGVKLIVQNTSVTQRH